MPARSVRYIVQQSAIGTCGHVVWTWPQVGNDVVCDECTREARAIDPDEPFIWVRLKPPKKTPRKTQPKAKPKRPWDAFLDELKQEGLF